MQKHLSGEMFAIQLKKQTVRFVRLRIHFLMGNTGTVPFVRMRNAERRRRSGAGHLRTDAAISDRDGCVGAWVAGPLFFWPVFFPRFERCSCPNQTMGPML